MQPRVRYTLVLGAMLMSCNGEAPTAPEAPVPIRPAIAGTYFIEAKFDELTNVALGSNGFLGLGQPSQDNPAMGGAIYIQAALGEDFFPSWDAEGLISIATAVQDVSLTSSNVISFTFAAQGTQWTFSGTVTGQTATGRHTLTDGATTLSGNWSMYIAEVDTRDLHPSTTAGVCLGVGTDGGWYLSYNGTKVDCFVFCPFCNFAFGTVDVGPSE